MREYPPKKPEIFEHEYDFSNRNILLKDNETLGKLNKGNIPIVFYNHLIFNKNNKFINNKYNYKKISMTQKNKKKLLTIIYYTHK